MNSIPFSYTNFEKIPLDKDQNKKERHACTECLFEDFPLYNFLIDKKCMHNMDRDILYICMYTYMHAHIYLHTYIYMYVLMRMQVKFLTKIY